MADDYGLLNQASEQNVPIQRCEVGELAFERRASGDVEVYVKGVMTAVIDSGVWASTVLSMTKFSERPNDWHRWIEHHQGTRDILSLICQPGDMVHARPVDISENSDLLAAIAKETAEEPAKTDEKPRIRGTKNDRR